MSDTTTAESNKTNGLKRSYLSSFEVLGQSIAAIAPSATPALVIPLVFGFAGNGTWLAYVIGLVVFLLVSFSINQFTKRSATPGNLYSFIVKGLGTDAGVITGWGLVLAYLLTASAVLCGYINYANVLIGYSGAAFPPILQAIILGIIGAAIAWYIAVKDIRLSTRVMLTCEIISMTLITLLAIIVIVNHGFSIDPAQTSLQGVSLSSWGIGLVLAFFSFCGFESATSLGHEAKDPLKTIPRAVITSTAVVGVFFILLSYVEVFSFQGSSTALNNAAAPLTDIANANGIAAFGPLISIGALISFWACFLACINAGSRVLYLMGQHGVVDNRVGNAHESNRTPHIAITASVIAASVIPFILIAYGGGLFDIYGWVGTVGTYGFVFAYALVAIAAPLYLLREKELKRPDIALAAVTILLLAAAIAGSIYSNNASGAPYSWFIYIFVGWLIAGGAWFLISKRRHPQLSSRITSEIEKVHTEFRVIRANGGNGPK
ncbi:amino acid permease-associated region [Methanoregula boonei 6A8]|uniref:Amino acid permease-associated region n=1 Tax=Methanoregula boonei (strain DSM 21154 / JCM 14090 / 6A8) TaxID=456442 RepID=A7I9V2_METB6|nr:APC family permease [Methanoregula boonei]ABS56513.1 amino acid permease-associated region [Methanoregula boonei 6A8]